MNDNNREYISIGANTQPQQNRTASKKKKSLLSQLLKATAIVFLMFIAFLFAAVIEEISREEDELADYGINNYYDIFGFTSADEDNILFVFLVDEEDYDDSSSMGIVGYNVNDHIHIMFEKYEDYYDLFEEFIENTSSVDCFSEDYAQVIDGMTDTITAYGVSVFKEPPYKSDAAASEIINKTSIDLSDGYLTAALERFTEKTGIPCVLLIEYERNVYSDVETFFDDVGVALVFLFALMVIATIIVAIITFLKSAGGNPTDGNRPVRTRESGGGFAEKCGKDGCDGRVRRDERPPWEYD